MKKTVYPKSYVRASQEQAYIVTFGWDSGNAESGPCWGKGEDLVYAISEKDACNKWENDNIGNFDYKHTGTAYEGCWARLATDDEVREFEEQRILDEKAWEEAVRLGYVDPDCFTPDPDEYGEIFD